MTFLCLYIIRFEKRRLTELCKMIERITERNRDKSFYLSGLIRAVFTDFISNRDLIDTSFITCYRNKSPSNASRADI